MRRLTPWALALTFSLASVMAHGQTPVECLPTPTPGPLEVTPASGAGGVTRDARISLRYTSGFLAGFAGVPSTLLTVWNDDTLEPVDGRVEVAADVLFFTPTSLLDSNALYAGRASGGISDFEFDFRTSASLDTLAPIAGAIQSVSTQSVGPSCGYPDGGFRVDLVMQRAIEDGPAGSLEYLLYQTRGVGLRAPVLRARRRGVTTADLFTMAFVLPLDEAVEPVCVVVQVVDGVGNRDDSLEARCFDPVQGNFFEPACSVATASRGAPSPFAWLGFGLLALVLTRRRLLRA